MQPLTARYVISKCALSSSKKHTTPGKKNKFNQKYETVQRPKRSKLQPKHCRAIQKSKIFGSRNDEVKKSKSISLKENVFEIKFNKSKFINADEFIHSTLDAPVSAFTGSLDSSNKRVSSTKRDKHNSKFSTNKGVFIKEFEY